MFNRLADLIDRDLNILANLETLDNGKPFDDAVFDVQATSDTFRYFKVLYINYAKIICKKCATNETSCDYFYRFFIAQILCGVC